MESSRPLAMRMITQLLDHGFRLTGSGANKISQALERCTDIRNLARLGGPGVHPARQAPRTGLAINKDRLCSEAVNLPSLTQPGYPVGRGSLLASIVSRLVAHRHQLLAGACGQLNSHGSPALRKSARAGRGGAIVSLGNHIAAHLDGVGLGRGHKAKHGDAEHQGRKRMGYPHYPLESDILRSQTLILEP